MMENANAWLKNSLFINIITFLFSKEVWHHSYLYRIFSGIKNFIVKILQGSVLGSCFTYTNWEMGAIKHSRFTNIIQRLNQPVDKLFNFLNNIIKNSYLYKIVLKAVRVFIETPFLAITHIVMPWILSNIVLKGVFEGNRPKMLLYGIIVLLLSFLLSSVKVSLGSLFDSSGMWKSIEWFFDKKVLGLSNGQGFTKTLTNESRLDLVSVGIIGGILYYLLPSTTFMKLFGLIIVSMLIYMWPELGLAFVAFMLPLAPTTYTVGIISLTFLSVLLNKNNFKGVLPTNIVPAMLFLVSAILAAVFSVMRTESLKTLPLYAAYFMIFYCASVLFKNKRTVKMVIMFLLISTLMLSLLGIYQFFFVKIPTAEAWVDVEQFPELGTRVYATLENPNVLGEYLGLAAPLVLGCIWASDKFRQRFFFTGLLGVVTLCLVLTFSRGAWLGLAVSVLAFVLLKEPRLLVLIVIVAILAPMFLPSVVTSRIASIGSLEDSSNAYRITIWIAVVRMIRDHWLNGVGLGLEAFSRVYRDYMIAGASAVHAHNLYLEVCLEMGVIGLLALLWMVFRGFSQTFVHAVSNDKMSFISTGIAAALAGHLFHGIFDFVWYSPRIVMAFWMYFGMMVAITVGNTAEDIVGDRGI